MDPYFCTLLIYAGVNIILAASLNLVTGWTGQFSLGHAGFMAIGGYFSAWITTRYQVEGAVPFLVALCAGGGVASVFGYCVGLPSLRLKGDYLAMVTLGFSEIIRVVLLNLEEVGGARGLTNIPGLTNVGWTYSFVVITVFLLWRFLNSPYGRASLAVREDEIAAESIGIWATRVKVRAFVLSAFFAGIAGGLFAHSLRYLNPQTFDLSQNIEIVTMVVLGGMGSLPGSIGAAVFLTGVREALRPLQSLTQLDFRMVIYALILILLMIFRTRREMRQKVLGNGAS